jgi:hypothetical protein
MYARAPDVGSTLWLVIYRISAGAMMALYHEKKFCKRR